MVRPAWFDSNGMKKGAWNKEEDNILRAYIEEFGHPNWRLLPLLAGLARCGKSCRLRWVNYLKPGLKRGKITKHEEDLIIKQHSQLGNKWSAIAAELPGRTDNEVKNYWHAHLNKRSKRNQTKVNSADQMPQQGQSSHEIKYCVTNDDHNQEKSASSEIVFPQGISTDQSPENIDALNSNVADFYSFTQTQGDLCTEPYQICFSQLNIDDQLPPFLDEELNDFGVCKNDKYSTFSDSSSEGGISTSLNSSSAKSLEDDTFYVELW